MLEAEVEVVADLELEARPLADLSQGDGVLGAAVGRVRIGQVGERGGERVAALLDLGELGGEPLGLGRDLLHPLDHRPGVLTGALRRGDLLRGLVLGRPAALDLREQLPTAGVELEQLVERRACAAALECSPGGSRVVANRP